MSVRMRHTRAHTRNRRSHHALSEPALTTDKKGLPHLRHRVSPITGKYKDRQVIDVDKKVQKKQAKSVKKKKKSE